MITNAINNEVKDPLLLSNGGKVYIELRPDLDHTLISNHSKPTNVNRGLVQGYSIPVYDNDDEELFLDICIPNRWDSESDIIVHVYCCLMEANNAKKFNLQVSWENYTIGDVIPDTMNDVEVETTTGDDPAHKSFRISFTIDYDIDGGGNEIAIDDMLNLRLRRLDASQDEIAGEVMIEHVGIVFVRDKLGTEPE